MEIKIIEDSEKRFVFELKGVDHTMANIVADELWSDSDVKVSGYNVSHPLVGVPRFIVETTKKKAKEAVLDAITRVKKHNHELAKVVSKL